MWKSTRVSFVQCVQWDTHCSQWQEDQVTNFTRQMKSQLFHVLCTTGGALKRPTKCQQARKSAQNNGQTEMKMTRANNSPPNGKMDPQSKKSKSKTILTHTHTHTYTHSQQWTSDSFQKTEASTNWTRSENVTHNWVLFEMQQLEELLN